MPRHRHGPRKGPAAGGRAAGMGPAFGHASHPRIGRSDDPMKRRLRAWPRLGLVVPLAAAVLLGASGPASAGAADALPGYRGPAAGPILPVTSCASLAHMNFTGVPDAPGKVISPAVVSDTLPAEMLDEVAAADFADFEGAQRAAGLPVTPARTAVTLAQHAAIPHLLAGGPRTLTAAGLDDLSQFVRDLVDAIYGPPDVIESSPKSC